MRGDNKITGGRRNQAAIDSLWKGKICLKIYHILFVSQHQLRGEMSKTSKKKYAASSNATSSSRPCKSVGDFSHCIIVFGKANRALLLAAEEICSSFLQRSELPYLLE